ncbi:hypothetical protein QIT80_gp23 (endogenous virus) [Pseudomonas phage phiAH14a]|uniref:Prophage PssSM-02 n=1 Tax=Pseudomonas phage phiAH14a TaxID=1805958 RepID=A0A1B0VMB8_9CAUD|nr:MULTISPECIES: hypothetical protein [unclassified Pseudomonas]YP_010773040.1 hypothetical protein QIT80_gp23 [Pseudomonas phage phiAH14a]AMW64483.1 hypothetical protein AH14a_p23 [Pseudomonas phage phiAH14a]KAA0946689.1 hypothetical protein FQ182_13260 [Pseudomonas sp. ANT_H4]KAA0953210.1 hypothetical protein FQ186_06605 [Pseudomonas sp. ANT_H14]
MSPHILIDEALEALAHPASEPGAEAVVQRMIINMLKGNVITIEEFNHYCGRLNKIVSRRKEAA